MYDVLGKEEKDLIFRNGLAVAVLLSVAEFLERD
jgi:hypothetical protein